MKEAEEILKNFSQKSKIPTNKSESKNKKKSKIKRKNKKISKSLFKLYKRYYYDCKIEEQLNNLVPMVVEQTTKGERAMIFTRGF